MRCRVLMGKTLSVAGPETKHGDELFVILIVQEMRRSDITEGLKRLQCRALILVGENSPFHLESLHMTSKPDTRFSALIEVSMLFAEWYQMYELPGVNDSICACFVLQLQQNGFLKADDTSDRFFRRLLDVVVSHCISSEVINSSSLQSYQQAQSLSFLAIDMYASLVFSILKFSPVDHGLSKLSLLSKVLAVTVRFIRKDAEEKKTSFNPRSYFRLFIDWLLDLSTLEPVFEGANLQVLTALATSFHALQPLKVPAFRMHVDGPERFISCQRSRD